MKICGDCAVSEGDLHQEGCDQERCPICKRQLLSCEHSWNELTESQREPFFVTRNFCMRCGSSEYSCSMLPDEEWEKICGVTYDKEGLLCPKCIKLILKLRAAGSNPGRGK